MTHNEFINIICAEGKPSLEDYRRVVAYARSASIEDLWNAIFTPGIHWIFKAVLNNILQEKIPQANLDASMEHIASKISRRGPNI